MISLSGNNTFKLDNSYYKNECNGKTMIKSQEEELLKAWKIEIKTEKVISSTKKHGRLLNKAQNLALKVSIINSTKALINNNK